MGSIDNQYVSQVRSMAQQATDAAYAFYNRPQYDYPDVYKRQSVNRSSAASTRRSTYTRPSSTRSSSYNSSVEGRVEAALERFTLERVAEELERTVDELLVPTTRRVDVPVPVSYTHLDVYKRQSVACCAILRT